MKSLTPIIKSWLIAATIITLLCGIIYGTIQQTYRTNANDPQYQMAEDAVAQLSNGADPRLMAKNAPIEISNNLASFLNIYDENGNAISANGLMDGKIPTLPSGVLAFAKEHGTSEVTWQPKSGVRMAIVVKYFEGSSKGFVVAGKSLRKTEERIAMLINLIIIGWLASLVFMILIIALINFILPDEKQVSKINFSV